jgi:hypothetical protein
MFYQTNYGMVLDMKLALRLKKSAKFTCEPAGFKKFSKEKIKNETQPNLPGTSTFLEADQDSPTIANSGFLKASLIYL